MFRAIDLLRGDSAVRSDTTFPDKREMARNTAGTTLAVLSAIFGPDNGLRAAYGYEADFGSLTPQSDEIAQGAFTVDVFDKDPAGTAGFDGHAGLTFVWVPSKAAYRTRWLAGHADPRPRRRRRRRELDEGAVQRHRSRRRRRRTSSTTAPPAGTPSPASSSPPRWASGEPTTRRWSWASATAPTSPLT